MIKKDQKIVIRWNSRNKNKYVELGYVFTRIGDLFEVDVSDAPPYGHFDVLVECDYCHKIITMSMTNYSRSTKDRNSVACDKCKTIKTRERLQERYGINAPFQHSEFLEKAKNTNIGRYGHENPMQNESIREKQVNTLIDKYSVDSPAKLPQHAEAMKLYDKESAKKNYVEICLSKYGVDNVAKLSEVISKAKATCIERYGGESSQCCEEVRAKSLATMLDGGDISTSRPEREMVKMLKDMYGEESCFPQYPLSHIAMDCLLVIDDVKIDIEYDGSYWHEMRKEQDKRRDYYCMNRGYKVLRFKGCENPPTKEQIRNSVDYLVNSQHNKLVVNI